MIHDYTCSNPIFADFETQSPIDLKKCGGLRYSESSDTRVLSLAVLIDKALHIWLPLNIGQKIPPIQLDDKYIKLYDSLHVHTTSHLPPPIEEATKDRVFVAHNCSHFDYFIWKNCVHARGLGSLPTRWADTLFLARIAGMPHGGLDAIAKRLLGTEKDSAKRLVFPLTQSAYVNGRVEHKVVTAGLIEPLIRYCSVDTLILPLLWEKFDSLRVEADVIQEHQNINERGVYVDLRLAAKLGEVSAYTAEMATKRIAEITNNVLHGDDPTNPDKLKRKGNLRSTQQVHKWLESQGVRIVQIVGNEKKLTLRADVVEKYLSNPLLMVSHDAELNLVTSGNVDDIPNAVFEVLRLRQSAIRIIGSKTDRVNDWRSADGRIRNNAKYHKALTGRDGGGGVNMYNMPRGKKGVPTAKLLEYYESGKWDGDVASVYEYIQSVLPVESETQKKLTVADALSALFRPCFMAEPGNKLAIADFAAIECRGIAWIAGEEKLLNQYRRGEDIYCQMASVLYGREITKENAAERFLGKTIVLGCGYQMGPDKFAITCGLNGINLRELGVTAEKCIDTYRATYPKIAGTYSGTLPDGRPYRKGGIWDKLGNAAMNAVLEGGLHWAGKYICYWYENNTLHCKLPSGRILMYNNCRVEDRVPGYAAHLQTSRMKPTLIYDSQFGNDTPLYGGKLAENVTQAAMRDIMYSAALRCAETCPLILSVYDEGITEAPANVIHVKLQLLCSIMSTSPDWAADLPITVEGHTSKRYLKEASVGEYVCEASGGEITKFKVKEK